MYTEKDLKDVISQRNRRWITLSVPVAAVLAEVIISLCYRQQVLTITTTIVLGFLLIAGYGLFIKPLNDYAKHLRNALTGRVREATLTFGHIEQDKATVDGVDYFPMVCTEAGDDGKISERLFYWDCEKQFPEIREGDRVTVKFHDREVCGITLA